MKTQEILSIIALSLLGLCFLSGLVKMAMNKESHKKPYEQGCTASVFIAVVLLGISQLLAETEPYTGSDSEFKPSSSDTRITLPTNGNTLYCPNTKDGSCDKGHDGKRICEIQTAHPTSANPYDVLVCKGGVYNMVSEEGKDGLHAYTSPEDARMVFSCDGRVDFSKMQDGTYMCGQKPGPALTAGKIKKVYCDPDSDDHPCYYEKTLKDCLKYSGCTSSREGSNTQVCEVCPNGQLLCGGC